MTRQITFGKNQQSISHDDAGRSSSSLSTKDPSAPKQYTDQISYALRDVDNLQYDVQAMQKATAHSPDALHAAQQYQSDLAQLQKDVGNAYSAAGGNADRQAYLAQIVNYADGLSQGEKQLTTYNLNPQDNPSQFNTQIDNTMNGLRTANGANSGLEKLDENCGVHTRQGNNYSTADSTQDPSHFDLDLLHGHLLG